MANIPSVEAMRAMTVGHYDDDELEAYVQAVIWKIENAAKEGLFFTNIEYKEIVDNPIYYDDNYSFSPSGVCNMNVVAPKVTTAPSSMRTISLFPNISLPKNVPVRLGKSRSI